MAHIGHKGGLFSNSGPWHGLGLAACQPGVRISFDENIVMQLSYHFQNIVKISLSSKFGRYHTINIYEILAYFSY